MFKFNPFPHIQIGIPTRIIISTAGSKEQNLMKGTEVHMGSIELIRGGKVSRD